MSATIAPVRRTWSAWRTVLLVLGIVFVLLGGGLLIGGGIGLLIHGERDADGFHTSDPGSLTTDAFAVYATDPLFADGSSGELRFRLESRNPETPLFIGIGPAGDVAKYLDGVGHAEVSTFDSDGFVVSYEPQPGGQPATDPAVQTFWVASDTGTGPRALTWDVAAGNWSLLIMNADRTQGVDIDATVGATLPFIFPITIALLTTGAILLITGTTMLAITLATHLHMRTRPRPAGL
jgi:hypothetical protein